MILDEWWDLMGFDGVSLVKLRRRKDAIDGSVKSMAMQVPVVSHVNWGKKLGKDNTGVIP